MGFMYQDLTLHPDSIGLCRVPPNGTICLTYHTYCLIYIFLQAKLAEELCQYVKRPLDSCYPRRHKNTFIRLEVGHQKCYALEKSLQDGLLLHLCHN